MQQMYHETLCKVLKLAVDYQAVPKCILIPGLGAEESQDPWLEILRPNQISWYYVHGTCSFYLDPICTTKSNAKKNDQAICMKQDLHQASDVLLAFTTRHSQIMGTTTKKWPPLKNVPEAAAQLSSVITLDPRLYAFLTFSGTTWKTHTDYHCFSL